MLSHTQWGENEQTLIHNYRLYIKSKINYVAIIYQSAKHSHIQTLDSEFNSSIKLSIETYRSSTSLA